jgi:hypothetical protein
LDWRLWVGLCKSKGYKLEALEEELKDRPGFSRQTLSKLSKRRDPAAPELVALAWGLEVRNGCQDDFELYWRGLASLGVEVPPALAATLSTPPPLRVDWTPKLDAIVSTLAGKLDVVASALGGKVDAVAASVRGKLDAFTSAMTAMLDSNAAKLDGVSGKLDQVATQVATVAASVATLGATINDVDAKSDVAAHQQARDTRRILHSLWGMGGLVSLVVVVAVRCQPSLTPPSSVNVNIGTGAVEEATKRQGDDLTWPFHEPLTGQMGKSKGRPMPHQPLPGQEVTPCTGSAVTLYGGCWFKSDRSAPCPPDLFEEGGGCYAPIRALPRGSPSGPPPLSPNPEQR